jgi:hypothetical protein
MFHNRMKKGKGAVEEAPPVLGKVGTHLKIGIVGVCNVVVDPRGL